jgi:HK97 family phage portal protein
MSFLSRRFGGPREQRAITEWGTSAIPGPLGGIGDIASYASVDLRRAEASLQKVAVWSAVDLIAGLAAQLPIDTYRQIRGQPEPEQLDNAKVITDPSGDGYGSSDWIYQYLISKLLRGNAYGRPILRDPRSGKPTAVPLLHPDDVHGWRDRRDGTVRWTVNAVTTPVDEIWHKRSYPLPGTLLGMSPISHHATTVRQGISAARFGTQFFTDGGHPASLFVNELVEVGSTQAAEIKAKVMSVIYGSREPLVIGKGWTHKPLSIMPNESQFLETQRFTGAECCRIFGPCIAEVYGYETGGSMTYQTIEQRSIDLLKFTLNRWLIDVEHALSEFIPAGQYVQLNRKAILQTDVLSRYRAHNMAIAGHWMAPSEVRPIEDMPKFTSDQEAEIEAMHLPPPEMNPLKESEK